MPRECPDCTGGERPACPDCHGNDEHPPQHCQDCPQLDASPSWSLYVNKTETGPGPYYVDQVKGCTHCGFTGWADQPAYGGSEAEGPCPECGETPDLKVLARKPPQPKKG